MTVLETAIAPSLAFAHARSDAFRRSEGEVDGLEVVRSLVRIGQVLSTGTSLGDRMQLLCEETASLLGCDRSSIMLWDGEFYRAAYNWGNPPAIAQVFHSYRIPADAPLMVEMEVTDSFVVVNDARSHSAVQKIAEVAGINSIVVAPMKDAGGERLGFITAEFNERLGSFDAQRAEIVLGFARLAQTAVVADRDRRQRRQSDLRREAMLAKFIDAEDEERRRLARELHDDSVQRAFALRLHLESAAAESRAIETSELDQMIGDVAALGTSLRCAINDMHPSAVDGRTLVDALATALERKATTTGWSTSLVDETTSQPSTTKLTVLFRIALQALHNAATHASADTVTIRLRTTNDGTEMRLRDDGRGFDLSKVCGGRFGLTSMLERAADAAGHLCVDSSPGRGTYITAWVPNQP